MTKTKKMMSYIGESALATGLFAVAKDPLFPEMTHYIALGAYAINPTLGAVVHSTCWFMKNQLYVGTLISPVVMHWAIYKNYGIQGNIKILKNFKKRTTNSL
jgi:hypothetical protein